MNCSKHQNDCRLTAFSPSDEELINYLLGHAAGGEDIRTRAPELEAWLAADSRRGERLEGLATSVLFAANESASWVSPAAPQNIVAQRVVLERKVRLRSVRFAMAVVFAASVLFVVVLANGPRGDSVTADRVAMAWADSLGLANDMESSDEIAVWLTQQSFALGGTDDFEGDDPDSPSFGFESSEPPEWLLTAVMTMAASGAESEMSEAVQ